MIEVFGNYWNYEDADLYCITTNGVVKKNGRCVMGRGIAQQARDRFRVENFDLAVGDGIKLNGNTVFLIDQYDGDWYASFPVKHSWWERADIDLIIQSAKDLVFLCDNLRFEHILLPRPGCGNGGLPWDETDHDRMMAEWTPFTGHKGTVNPKPESLPIVKHAIQDILDDRFHVIERTNR